MLSGVASLTRSRFITEVAEKDIKNTEYKKNPFPACVFLLALESNKKSTRTHLQFRLDSAVALRTAWDFSLVVAVFIWINVGLMVGEGNTESSDSWVKVWKVWGWIHTSSGTEHTQLQVRRTGDGCDCTHRPEKRIFFTDWKLCVAFNEGVVIFPPSCFAVLHGNWGWRHNTKSYVGLDFSSEMY